MRRRLVLLLLLLLGWWAGAGRAQAPASDFKPTVILVSLDGWRWDYAQKYSAPTLTRLMASGVSGALIPSFPSKTFPNHYTIVTGLYPGHHGIVGNSVKDPPTGRRFSMSNRKEVQDPMWWGGEPIWVTLQRAGQVAAPLFWPGSEAPIHGATGAVLGAVRRAGPAEHQSRSRASLARPSRGRAAHVPDALLQRRRWSRTRLRTRLESRGERRSSRGPVSRPPDSRSRQAPDSGQGQCRGRFRPWDEPIRTPPESSCSTTIFRSMASTSST